MNLKYMSQHFSNSKVFHIQYVDDGGRASDMVVDRAHTVAACWNSQGTHGYNNSHEIKSHVPSLK